jgi:hypothetical protein
MLVGVGVSRLAEHRIALRALPAEAWPDYLARHSGLPGPRANLELAAAVAEEAPGDRLHAYARSSE